MVILIIKSLLHADSILQNILIVSFAIGSLKPKTAMLVLRNVDSTNPRVNKYETGKLKWIKSFISSEKEANNT